MTDSPTSGLRQQVRDWLQAVPPDAVAARVLATHGAMEHLVDRCAMHDPVPAQRAAAAVLAVATMRDAAGAIASPATPAAASDAAAQLLPFARRLLRVAAVSQDPLLRERLLAALAALPLPRAESSQLLLQLEDALEHARGVQATHWLDAMAALAQRDGRLRSRVQRVLQGRLATARGSLRDSMSDLLTTLDTTRT